MDELIQVTQIEPGISSVVLNRPDRRNALSIDLLDQLAVAVEALEQDALQRIVILRGNGVCFSAGLDLREASDDALVAQSAQAVSRALRLMRVTPLITIAAAHGAAFAGGAGLMAACDIVVAADNTSIGFPEARRGLLPALISDVLRGRVKEGDLRDLFLTGDPISVHQAQRMGLVQRIVPAKELMDEVMRVAHGVLAGGPETIRNTKRLLNAMYSPDSTGSTDMSELHMTARRSDEAKEGLAAFIEKREPNWRKEAKS